MKKIVAVMVIFLMCGAAVFAQFDLSAGLGGNFGVAMVSYSHKDYDVSSFEPNPLIGGGFHAFFDATYGTFKVGMGFYGEEDGGVTTTVNYFSLGLLGKFPINLGAFTLYPLLGFEYNIFTSMKMSQSGFSLEIKRADLDIMGMDGGDVDMFVLQLGVGADFFIGSNIFIRPAILWGIDLSSGKYEKQLKDQDITIFKHKLDVVLAVGYKF